MTVRPQRSESEYLSGIDSSLILLIAFTLFIFGALYVLMVYIPSLEQTPVCEGKVMTRGELISWIVENHPEIDVTFKSTGQLGSYYNKTKCGEK
jgi:hypothetical protein